MLVKYYNLTRLKCTNVFVFINDSMCLSVVLCWGEKKGYDSKLIHQAFVRHAHLSSNQNPGYLLYIGEYTTQLYIYIAGLCLVMSKWAMDIHFPY